MFIVLKSCLYFFQFQNSKCCSSTLLLHQQLELIEAIRLRLPVLAEPHAAGEYLQITAAASDFQHCHLSPPHFNDGF